MSEKNCIWYQEDDFDDFLKSLICNDALDNPRTYSKAVRNTLIACGYAKFYVNGKFKECLESYIDNIASDNQK